MSFQDSGLSHTDLVLFDNALCQTRNRHMRDEHGLVVDHTGDGGDSCNFTCWEVFLKQSLGLSKDFDSRVDLFWQNGSPVRHPFQEPWNNPRNFSRDQAIALVSVLPEDKVRIFYQTLKQRFFFFPNDDRDSKGTRKYPFPHGFVNDHGRHEIRSFDFADPMTPDFFGVLITRGKLQTWNWFLPIAKTFCRMSLRAHCRLAERDPTYNDFKQLYITAKILGLHKEFIEKHPRGLAQASEIYFGKRRKLWSLHELFLQELALETTS